MADGVTITDGSGAPVVVSSDDIAGVEVQRVKIQWGVDGVATDVSSAAPIPTADAAVLDKLNLLADTGAWGQAAGAGPGTIIVPVGARLHTVEVIPSSPTGIVTLSVFGDDVFSQVVGYGIGRDYRGRRTAGAGVAGHVVVGGGVGTYHVDWIV